VRIRVPLLMAAATVAFSLALLMPAAEAGTGPLGFGTVCNTETDPLQLCLSANGTLDDPVYGKDYSSTAKAEDGDVQAADECAGADVVTDTSTEQCPFTTGSDWNNQYKGDLIVSIFGGPSDLTYTTEPIGPQNSDVLAQEDPGETGYEWVLVPAGTANQYYIVSVHYSVKGSSAHLCADGANAEIVVTPSWLGAGACTWVLPPAS
jgi:hypothetical protein